MGDDVGACGFGRADDAHDGARRHPVLHLERELDRQVVKRIVAVRYSFRFEREISGDPALGPSLRCQMQMNAPRFASADFGGDVPNPSRGGQLGYPLARDEVATSLKVRPTAGVPDAVQDARQGVEVGAPRDREGRFNEGRAVEGVEAKARIDVDPAAFAEGGQQVRGPEEPPGDPLEVTGPIPPAKPPLAQLRGQSRRFETRIEVAGLGG